jgi:hypothetical protein
VNTGAWPQIPAHLGAILFQAFYQTVDLHYAPP